MADETKQASTTGKVVSVVAPVIAGVCFTYIAIDEKSTMFGVLAGVAFLVALAQLVDVVGKSK